MEKWAKNTKLWIVATTIVICIVIVVSYRSLRHMPSEVIISKNYISSYRPKLKLADSEDIRSGFYLYTWTDFCQESLEHVKTWSLFPYYPIEKYSIINNLNVIVDRQGNYTQRMFGYLKPPRTGYYFFRTNKKNNLEIWMSPDASPINTERILTARNEAQIMLGKNKYYYTEILYTMPVNGRNFHIEWMIPGQKKFEIIQNEYLFRIPKLRNNETKNLGEYLPHFHYNKLAPSTKATRPNLFKFPPLPNVRNKFYNECSYSPSFAVKRNMSFIYEGASLVTSMWLAIYPDDGTTFGNNYEGNPSVDISEVETIFKDFEIRLLKERRDIKLVKLVNFEKQYDEEKGSRYLIETEITLMSNDINKYRFSYHVYAPFGGALCHPYSLQIHLQTFVYIAVTAKNQGHWMRYFIENMERLYDVTKDERFGVIIVDFESEDLNIKKLIEKSKLRNIHLITLEGSYSRSISLNKAINFVANDDDILFACDLQLDIPMDIIDVIRTHTFRGVSGYAPGMFRLDCGYNTEFVVGIWELYTYGMFSMFKADWSIIGGFNEEQYKYEWGGEDWELLDRFLEHGYFVERFRQPYLFHFYHDRKKMWIHDFEGPMYK